MLDAYYVHSYILYILYVYNVYKYVLGGEEHICGNTLFIMVARDPATHKGWQVPPLIIEDDASQARFDLGKQRAAYRKQRAAQSLTLTAPKPDEIDLIHKLYLDSKTQSSNANRYAVITAPTSTSTPDATTNPSTGADVLKSSAETLKTGTVNMPLSKWMKDTIFKNTLFMHAQERNLHGKIFGGYLMRMAFELAHITSMCYYGSPIDHSAEPRFIAVDDIQFVKAVNVGAIIELKSVVTYQQG